MSSSLSSVVSNLVRASMGSGVSNTVTDEDLDRHVAELILREAKQKAERYGTQGIRAYLPTPESNVPKTNKRFLTSIIKSTDDHNKTVLRAQAQAAEEVKRERAEAERQERRARAEEAVSARTGVISGRVAEGGDWRKGDDDRRSSRRDDSGRRRHREASSRSRRDEDGEGSSSRRPKRAHEALRGSKYALDDLDSEEDVVMVDRSSPTHSPVRSRTSHTSSTGPSHRDSASPEHRKLSQRTHSPSRRPSREELRSRRDRSRSPRRSREGKEHRSKRRRSRSPSSSEARRQSRRARSPSPHSRSRSPPPRHGTKGKRRQSAERPESVEPSSKRRRSSRERRKSPEPVKRRSCPEPKPVKPTRRSASPPLRRVPARPPSPEPGPQPNPTLPSKMDKYFEESYDPRLDVAPLTAPTVPMTGLIVDADYEGWDAMLEMIRIRREDKEEKKQMERLGILPPKKDRSSKTKTKANATTESIAASAVGVADRWGQGGVSIMDIEYKKKGSVREWDMGKTGF